MTVMVTSHPLVMENLGAFDLNVFDVSESPDFVLEWLTTASAKVIRLLEGIRFVSHKKRDVL